MDLGEGFLDDTVQGLAGEVGEVVAFTMKQYVQTDLEADREVANIFAEA